MPRGRPPKPTRLKILSGNPGKRPLNTREPKPSSAVPRCPVWLDAEAKRKWKQLAPELARLGLLTALDGDALAAYCTAWADFRRAAEVLKKEGTIIEKPSGASASHPAVAQQQAALQAMRSFMALFGMDPSSRSKLHVGGQEEDELAEFLSKSS